MRHDGARSHRLRVLSFAAAGAAAAAAAALCYKRPLWVIDQAIRARLRLAGFESRFLRIGSHRMHYFVGGKGRPMLLIHGLGAAARDWTPQMPGYARNGFRVYALDLLGCGYSDRPDIVYSIQQQVDLVERFLDAMRVDQVDLIGWSMGGWIALKFALEHPQRVRRLVAMNSAGLTFDAPDYFEPRSLSDLQRLIALLMPRQPALPGFLCRDLLRKMRRNSPVTRRMVNSMKAGNDLLDGRLERIEAPTLIVWADQDALIPPAIGLEMHRKIPQSVLQIYSGCGHLAPATHAGRIVPRVLEFLRSEPPASGGVFYY